MAESLGHSEELSVFLVVWLAACQCNFSCYVSCLPEEHVLFKLN